MSYYKIFGLNKEPFSTSPDPAFFYRSSNHDAALKRIEIALRLRRGLCLVLGDVGIGKTTLLRTLVQNLSNEEDFEIHMLLDPNYISEFQFLSHIIKLFKLRPMFKSTLDYKEAIEKYLYQKGVEENKTVVLFIDEGQKLKSENLEILRMFLNYETNEYKLLQLVILSQLELLPRLRKIRNFMDRVALKYIINPLDLEETKNMISFRLYQAGFNSGRSLFSDDAIKLIYQNTQGYPRKIAMFCHDALEFAVMKEKDCIDESLIQSLIINEVK
jgi:general secretion pathway protein A